MFEQGDLEELPCSACPVVAVDVPDDHYSDLTFRLIELSNGGLSREQPPPWELLIRSAGIHDLETFTEVWLRMGIARRVFEEAERRRNPSPRS